MSNRTKVIALKLEPWELPRLLHPDSQQPHMTHSTLCYAGWDNGGARGEDRERCLQEGLDEYLSKPVRKAPLLEMVRQSMRGPG